MKQKTHYQKKYRLVCGDKVIVRTGSDKGKQGVIKQIDRKKDRAIVEGVAMRIKHVKPSAQNPEGGRIRKEGTIHLSNLAFIDGSGNPTRIRFSFQEDGTKVRMCVSDKTIAAKPLRPISSALKA